MQYTGGTGRLECQGRETGLNEIRAYAIRSTAAPRSRGDAA
jgi:hypothetical protein